MGFYLVIATDIIFFCDLLEIKIVIDFRFFSFVCRSNLIYEPCRIVGIFSLPFQRAAGNHFFSTADLLGTDSLLVCGIFGGIGYDQPLMKFLCSVRFIFIKKSLFIIIRKLCDINRGII